jgi:hypothetical protein
VIVAFRSAKVAFLICSFHRQVEVLRSICHWRWQLPETIATFAERKATIERRHYASGLILKTLAKNHSAAHQNPTESSKGLTQLVIGQ